MLFIEVVIYFKFSEEAINNLDSFEEEAYEKVRFLD